MIVFGKGIGVVGRREGGGCGRMCTPGRVCEMFSKTRLQLQWTASNRLQASKSPLIKLSRNLLH